MGQKGWGKKGGAPCSTNFLWSGSNDVPFAAWLHEQSPATVGISTGRWSLHGPLEPACTDHWSLHARATGACTGHWSLHGPLEPACTGHWSLHGPLEPARATGACTGHWNLHEMDIPSFLSFPFHPHHTHSRSLSSPDGRRRE